MSLTIFSNGCDTGIELDVDIGLSTASGLAGIWDVALWDSDVWGPDVVWESVSDYVMSITTDRKFSRGQRTWSAGNINVVLNNITGRFSPDNVDPAAPYVVGGISSIRPGIPIRAYITYNSIIYHIFYGYVISWGEVKSGPGPRQSGAYVTVVGTDEWGRLAKAKGYAVTPVGASDTFGDRIVRILNAAGFTGNIDTDEGYTTLQATDLSSDRVTELNNTARAEGGFVWASPTGSIIARDRYSLVEDIRSVEPQAIFGDGDTDIPICWLGSSWVPPDGTGELGWSQVDVAPLTDEMIINHAVYERDSGTTQEYSDPVSIALYGIRTDSVTGLLNETDAQVLTLAEWAVLINKDPEARVEKLVFTPRCDIDTYIPIMLNLDMNDLVLFKMRPPTIYASHIMERYCHIHGISITIVNNNMTIAFDLESATAYVAYATSRWDIGLWGSSDVDPAGARWFV